MAVKTIPVLPADYPLFNWDGHGDSRAALYQGGPVAAFRKETWNAMVDTVLDAMAEAGLSWDDAILPAASVKISEAYGALSAPMFNALAGNILQAVPIGGYRWAVKPSFRGYLGRNAFRGYATHGKESDFVYPEYFVELARRLDLMLQVMRGDAPFAAASADGFSQSFDHAALVSPLACVIAGLAYSSSDSNAEAVAPLAELLQAALKIGSGSNADIFAAGAKRLHSQERLVASLNLADVSTLMVKGAAQHQGILYSLHRAAAWAMSTVAFGRHEHLMRSRCDAVMGADGVKSLDGGRYSVFSDSTGAVSIGTALPVIRSACQAESRHVGKIGMSVPVGMDSGSIGSTAHTGAVEQRATQAMSGAGVAVSQGSGSLALRAEAFLQAQPGSESRCAAAVDCSWHPPVLRDGILSIRSSYEAVLQDNVLEVI